MDNKVFELLEKTYVDLSGKIDSMNKEMQEVKENMATKHDIVKLENKMDINHKALYDGYKLTYEKLTAIEKKVDEIEGKVERHDVKIKVVKEVK